MNIELVHINKSFGKNQVLEDINMIFTNGKINCIMGASGIGKTTLIHILMGLIKPDSGNILGIQGKHISAVFQEDRLIEHWDAVKNVMLVCQKGQTQEKVKNHFSRVGLTEYEGKPVLNLSGGMRRRVSIVRALLADYDLIIMDEPFKGLDETLKQQVIDYVVEETLGKTIIIVTHDKDEIKKLGADLILMK